MVTHNTVLGDLEATTQAEPLKQLFYDKVFAVERGKDIIERLWSELGTLLTIYSIVNIINDISANIWRNAVIQLTRGVHELDEFNLDNTVVKLLQRGTSNGKSYSGTNFSFRIVSELGYHIIDLSDDPGTAGE